VCCSSTRQGREGGGSRQRVEGKEAAVRRLREGARGAARSAALLSIYVHRYTFFMAVFSFRVRSPTLRTAVSKHAKMQKQHRQQQQQPGAVRARQGVRDAPRTFAIFHPVHQRWPTVSQAPRSSPGQAAAREFLNARWAATRLPPARLRARTAQ